MKKHILFSFSLLLCSLTFGQTFNTTMLLNNGPIDRRINIVILGDGFKANEQDEFLIAANNLRDYFISVSPYSGYIDYFNIIAVEVISAESGVKHPGTATDVTEPVFPVSNPDNYLQSSFDHQDIHRCIYPSSTMKTTQVLAANTPYYDVAVVIGNSPEYGGCAGTYAYFTTNVSSKTTFIHELGHSFAYLADEYWFPGSGERVNKTQDGDPLTNKWRNWIGYNLIGIYPFVEDSSWYRPAQNCTMRYSGVPFCSVCKEAIVERIHELVSPIEEYSPTSLSLDMEQNNLDFEVSLILPDPSYLEFSWELNGTEINNQDIGISISENDLVDGANTLKFSVIDNTPLVRTDNHDVIHLNTVVWTINKSGLGIEEIKATTSNLVLYPNPSADVIYVKSNKKSTGSLTFELVSITGQLVKKENLSPDASQRYTFATEGLESQTYILNIYDSNGVKLYTHRIIKK